jgi:hypothetical protein
VWYIISTATILRHSLWSQDKPGQYLPDQRPKRGDCLAGAVFAVWAESLGERRQLVGWVSFLDPTQLQFSQKIGWVEQSKLQKFNIRKVERLSGGALFIPPHNTAATRPQRSSNEALWKIFKVGKPPLSAYNNTGRVDYAGWGCGCTHHHRNYHPRWL